MMPEEAGETGLLSPAGGVNEAAWQIRAALAPALELTGHTCVWFLAKQHRATPRSQACVGAASQATHL